MADERRIAAGEQLGGGVGDEKERITLFPFEADPELPFFRFEPERAASALELFIDEIEIAAAHASALGETREELSQRRTKRFHLAQRHRARVALSEAGFSQPRGEVVDRLQQIDAFACRHDFGIYEIDRRRRRYKNKR